MKSTVKQMIQNKRMKTESKSKIYVPIDISPTSIKESRELKDSVIVLDDEMNELKKTNNELRQKQMIYIDKLMKLQGGLQRQHKQFIKLQTLYNDLYNQYKCKQEQISQLQQKYRQTNYKKQSLSIHQQYIIQNQLKKQIYEQQSIIQQLSLKINQYNNTIQQLQKTINKLYQEIIYIKNKQKIKEFQDGLNFKEYLSIHQFQKIIQELKEDKIKLQYQNKFFKSRNNDLQIRVNQLQQFIHQKQCQLTKLRQNNILLSRQNSQSRLSRSVSRSSCVQLDKQNIYQNYDNQALKITKIVQNLHNENKQLKIQVSILQNKLNLNYHQNIIKCLKDKDQCSIKQQEFFSFSREDNMYGIINQEIKKQGGKEHGRRSFSDNHAKQKGNSDGSQQKNQRSQQKFNDSVENTKSQTLQDLPSELEIENLIVSSKKKQELDFIQ